MVAGQMNFNLALLVLNNVCVQPVLLLAALRGCYRPALGSHAFGVLFTAALPSLRTMLASGLFNNEVAGSNPAHHPRNKKPSAFTEGFYWLRS